MEGEGALLPPSSSENRKEEEQQGASYTYWVRQVTEDAAPLPVPRKLSPQDIISAQSHPSNLGSLWNRVHNNSSFLLLLVYRLVIYDLGED